MWSGSFVSFCPYAYSCLGCQLNSFSFLFFFVKFWSGWGISYPSFTFWLCVGWGLSSLCALTCKRELISPLSWEPSYTVAGTVNWCSHCGKQYGCSPKKLKIGLPCNAAVPPLGIYPDKTVICKDRCIHMFTAAIFPIAKTWNNPDVPQQMSE